MRNAVWKYKSMGYRPLERNNQIRSKDRGIEPPVKEMAGKKVHDYVFRGSTYPSFTPPQFAKFLAGEIRVFWWDELVLRPLTNAERAIYDRAVENGYVIAKKKTDMATAAYYCYCEIEGKTAIEVQSRAKYATVIVDYITCGDGNRPTEHEKTEMKQLLISYQQYWQPKKEGKVGRYSFIDVAKDVAEEVAAELAQICMREAV